MADAAQEKPVLLIAMEEEWAARSLESVLVSNGYGVIRAKDGKDALAWARRIRPDALILDELPSIDGLDVCAELRADPRFDAFTPIVIAASSPAGHALRQKAYSAGAWEFCTHPIDTDTLLLKLDTFIRARRAALSAERRAFVDESTGLLTPAGLEHWAEQLMARATRNREALACVVLMPVGMTVPAGHGLADHARADDRTSTVEGFLELARDAFRRSDVVGCTTDGQLALIAPDTDSAGVQGMLARLRRAISTAALSRPIPRELTQFRAGYWAVEDFSTASVEPAEVVRRAIKALERSGDGADSRNAFEFDQLPVS